MLKTGANIREVQEFLGHSSITTTEIYTHVVQARLETAVRRAVTEYSPTKSIRDLSQFDIVALDTAVDQE